MNLNVWFVDPDHIRDTALLGRYWEILNKEERVRHSRFVTPKLKHDFLVTRAFVRDVLSRTVHGAIHPSAWKFKENPFGRPEVANDAYAGHLHFNLSHTAGLITCVTGPIYEIGIDVENATRDINYLNLGESSFSPTEFRDLQGLSGQEQRERFFEYWTLKESYIKARGMGLSLPLDGFTFRFRGPRIFPARTIEIGFGATATPDPAWSFRFLRPTDRHLVAVGALAHGAPVTMHQQWLVPLTEPRKIATAA